LKKVEDGLHNLRKKGGRAMERGHGPIVPKLGIRYIAGVRIIARSRLREFRAQETSSEQPLKAWFAETRKARWATPADVKKRYTSASVLPGGRVVFNIGGNAFRLVVRINYRVSIVYIRFIGKHSEYDKIDAETI
jgi:mRNA interferase HigB